MLKILYAFFALSAAAQTVGDLELMGADAKAVTFKGKTAIQLNEVPGNSTGNALAIVKGPAFHNGTIEFDVAGQLVKGASPTARGFVGLAFRVQPKAEKFEYFYIRPVNGRANDQVQRNHATQYASHPAYPWPRLRTEEPGKYESYVDLEPGVWVKIRITVSGASAKFYINGATQPTLLVNDLKLGDSEGGIALWLGPEAEGYFANLKISRETRSAFDRYNIVRERDLVEERVKATSRP
jgi:hypothetical protein